MLTIGGYYLYTSGGDANAAKRKFETDARNARERSLDGAERVGDKIDRAYDEAKEKIEKGYKSSKAEVEKEWNKEKQEIGKQVEVCPPDSPPQTHPHEQTPGKWTWEDGFTGRWASAFGGFGGLGLRIVC